jgi:hypothetical protein
LSLQADRAAMRGLPPPSAEAMARAAARSASNVRAQLPLIEDMLSDEREWIVGPAPTIADFSIYHALWFITGRTERLAHELDPFEHTQAWMTRVAAFGHGVRQSMTPEAALDIAAAATPRSLGTFEPFAEDPSLGARVRIRADDYGCETVEGELVMISAHEIAIRRKDESLGELIVHFPRLGYDLREI